MFDPRIGELIDVSIEKLSFGGDGIARYQGWTVFIPFSAPQDQLRVQISELKSNYLRAEIKEILIPGPGRTKARCPVFSECGGCQWQHLSYQTQLTEKKQIVYEALKGLLDSTQSPVDVLPSPKEFHYRNRIQLKYSKSQLGYFRRRSNDLIEIQECPLAENEINAQIPILKESLAKKKHSKPSSEPEKHIIYRDDKGKTSFVSIDAEYEFLSQVNDSQNKVLIETVLQKCQGLTFEHIYDLYAGSGNFTYPLLEQFPRVQAVAVELSHRSVLSALTKQRSLNMSSHKLRFFCDSVENFLARISLKENSLVLLDPPRMGCSEDVIRALAKQKISRLFYVSCNPSTLQRDLKLLRQNNPRWRLLSYHVFDMFPQTYHIETLVELGVDT